MSVQAITSALAFRGLCASDKLLLLVLANYADAENRCWPSHSRLAEDTELSERTILTAFRRLEEAGALIRREQRREDGSRRSDLITLTLGGGEMVAPRGEKAAGGGEAVAPGVGKRSRGGGEMVAPLTSFEPSREPSKDTETGSAEPERRRAAPPPDFELAWKAYPHVQGRSSKKDALVEWRKLSPEVRAALPPACGRYADEGREPKSDCGAPAMERWLRKGRFTDWLTAAPSLALVVTEPVSPWPMRLRRWTEDRYWDADWGPRPGREGCLAPAGQARAA